MYGKSSGFRLYIFTGISIRGNIYKMASIFIIQ